jgi:PIN domain nuclease of toxin-antitoxin system
VRFILDTHALIWFIEGHPLFSSKAQAALEQDENEVFVSLATIWEIAIKVSLQKLRLHVALEDELRDLLDDNGFELLDIGYSHLACVATLPFKHKDPFDRLLVAQSLVEEMALISHDSIMDAYGIKRLW